MTATNTGSADNSARSKLIDAFLKTTTKKYGDTFAMRAGDTRIGKVDVIPTGSPALDLALGVGGYPRGRIVEIYGPESAGKTTMMVHAMVEAQKAGGAVYFVDMEQAFDVDRARQLGMDVEGDNFVFSQPATGEEALDAVEMAIELGVFDMIVVDSIATMTPRAEAEGDMGQSQPGLMARMLGQGLRRISPKLGHSKTVLLFTNQIREKIGVMYGNPETQPGGRAMKFYATIRLDIRKIGQPIMDGKTPIGQTVKIKVAKNKVAPPFKVAEDIAMMFDHGIDVGHDLMNIGINTSIINRSGAFYSIPGIPVALSQEKFQGKEALKEELQNNAEAAAWLREQILNPAVVEKVFAGETTFGSVSDDLEEAEEAPDDLS